MTVYLRKLEGITHFKPFILNIATQPRTYMVLDLDTQNGPQHSQVKRDHTTVCERGEHAGGKGASHSTSLELAHYSSQ